MQKTQVMDYLWARWNTIWLAPEVVSRDSGFRSLRGLMVDVIVRGCTEVLFDAAASPFEAGGPARIAAARAAAEDHTRSTYVDSVRRFDRAVRIRYRIGLMTEGGHEYLPAIGLVLHPTAFNSDSRAHLSYNWQVVDPQGLRNDANGHLGWEVGPEWVVDEKNIAGLMALANTSNAVRP